MPVATFSGVEYLAPEIIDPLGGATGLTISVWVKRARSQVASDHILDFGNSIAADNIALSFAHQMSYEVYHGSVKRTLWVGFETSGPSQFPQGVWTHVAVVHEPSGKASIFWDGELMASAHVWLPKQTPRARYYIGRSTNATDPYFKGAMRDFLLYSRALTATEIVEARNGDAHVPPDEELALARTMCHEPPPLCLPTEMAAFNGVNQYYPASIKATGEPTKWYAWWKNKALSPDQAATNAPLGGQSGITIAVWVRRTRFDQAEDHLVDFGNGYLRDTISLSFANDMTYAVARGTEGNVETLSVAPPEESTRNSTFPPYEWTHVTIVHDSTGVASIYWDGILKAQGTVWLPKAVARSHYWIGRSHHQGDPFFAGWLHDLIVYNRVLSLSELDDIRQGIKMPEMGASPVITWARTWCGDGGGSFGSAAIDPPSSRLAVV